MSLARKYRIVPTSSPWVSEDGSSAAYRFLYSATLSLNEKEIRHRTHIGELERQFRESMRKFLVENADLKQRVDTLQAKLFTLQTDRNPTTLVSKLQEQATRNS